MSDLSPLPIQRPRGSAWVPRWSLPLVDSVAVALAWLVALLLLSTVSRDDRSVLLSVVVVVVIAEFTVLLLAAQGLYLPRVASIRSVEMARVVRTVPLVGVVVGFGAEILDLEIGQKEIIPGAVIMLVLMLVGRAGHRAWLTGRRKAGRYLQPVLVIGANDEARDLVELLAIHPELGLDVVGVLGDRRQAESARIAHLHVGEVSALHHVLDSTGAGIAMVAVSAFPSSVLNRIIRELMLTPIETNLTTGVRGIDASRIQVNPVAYEPLVHLERVQLSSLQLGVKRAIDLAGALVLLVATLPVVLPAAIAVKLTDRGPVFFRQERIGRNGERFRILKLRTMVVDAEARLAELRARSEREGALFKMDRDPRFTRIGRLLDASGVNELPQLINVLRGEMSLVGPRPALPSEVSQFSADMHVRSSVRPGITGLWQVEANDNPSFEAYRRLDLFYVENWSVTFDMVILLATAEVILARVIRLFLRSDNAPTGDTRIAHSNLSSDGDDVDGDEVDGDADVAVDALVATNGSNGNGHAGNGTTAGPTRPVTAPTVSAGDDAPRIAPAGPPR